MSVSQVELRDFQMEWMDVECEGKKEGIKDDFTKISSFSV